MGKVIAVVSGKGGTGKTTTVGAIGSCLAVMGYRTLCVDCDSGLRNLDLTLGMSERAVRDYSDVLSGAAITEAASEHPEVPGLWFLSAPSVSAAREADVGALAGLAESAREAFDFCLLDSPAGIGPGFRFTACCADAALIVTTGDAAGIRGAQRVSQELDGLGVTEQRLIVNRVDERQFRRSGMTVDDIIDITGVQLIGLVYEDRRVPLAANSEKALVLYERSGAAVQFLRAAQRLCGERVDVSPTSKR